MQEAFSQLQLNSKLQNLGTLTSVQHLFSKFQKIQEMFIIHHSRPTKKTFKMIREFQSEFRIYRQRAGGNYMISADQVLNGLRLERLKLFKTLSFESKNEHVEDSCCKEGLTKNELMFIEECFDRVYNLNDVERGTVTYITGLCYQTRIWEKL